MLVMCDVRWVMWWDVMWDEKSDVIWYVNDVVRCEWCVMCGVGDMGCEMRVLCDSMGSVMCHVGDVGCGVWCDVWVMWAMSDVRLRCGWCGEMWDDVSDGSAVWFEVQCDVRCEMCVMWLWLWWWWYLKLRNLYVSQLNFLWQDKFPHASCLMHA